MRRVAEVMYIVESEREEFLKGALNPDEETKKVLWLCGVRKQQYFALNDTIFMTFEYEGNDFVTSMEKMASYLDSKGLLVKTRRKDVPTDQLKTTSWWAPVKKLGTVLESDPGFQETEEFLDVEMLGMSSNFSKYSNISFDEDEWAGEVW